MDRDYLLQRASYVVFRFFVEQRVKLLVITDAKTQVGLSQYQKCAKTYENSLMPFAYICYFGYTCCAVDDKIIC